MYGKFIENELYIAQDIFVTPDNKIITNFNKSIELMTQYGFKEITGIVPDYDDKTETLRITGHTETDAEIECTYEVIPKSELLKNIEDNNMLLGLLKGEILAARIDEKGVEYSSLQNRINNIKTHEYERVDIEGDSPSINIEDKKAYICGEISSLGMTLVNIADVNFRTRIYFKAASDINCDTFKFMGDHCENGILKAKTGNEYIIDLIYTGQVVGIVSTSNVMEGDAGNPDEVGEETTELHSFTGKDQLMEVAMTYYNVRETYMTYGMTNILTDNSTKSWTEVTVSGADSPDNRYRKLDCSAFVNLVFRGITFDEVLKNQTVYNGRNLTPRTSTYSWATNLGRTSADICKTCDELGWNLPPDKWHTDGSNWAGLEVGDLIFFKNDTDNGRYKNIGHVSIYYGLNSENNPCVIEFTSSTGVKKHTDGKSCGIQVLQFAKKNRSAIVSIARCQK